MELSPSQAKAMLALFNAKKTNSLKVKRPLQNRINTLIKLQKFQNLQTSTFTSALSPITFWLKAFITNNKKPDLQQFLSRIRIQSIKDKESGLLKDQDIQTALALPHYFNVSPTQSKIEIRNFHVKAAEIALEAIRTIPREERFFSTSIFRMSKSRKNASTARPASRQTCCRILYGRNKGFGSVSS